MLQSHGVFFGQKLKIFYYLHRQDPLKFFIFFVKNMYLTPQKKIIKFTRISRTVWNFATKIEISQNTKNFHPCNLKMIAYIELKLL